MLPRANRLTAGADFRRAIRSGRRAGSATVVVHGCAHGGAAAPRVGFVVSKAVGSAVARNRVKRRLRHLCRDRVGGLPTGSLVVVRALPGAAGATYEQLGSDLTRCLARVVEGWAA